MRRSPPPSRSVWACARLGRASGGTGPARRRTVYTAEIDGIIHPVAAEYVRETIATADAAGAALVVFTLRTPGGLVDSTRDINNAIIRAKTPVAVFVGPSGNRAASAGFLITIAADIAAMAPATHIGAAHPVAGNGEKVDDTMAKKMASDVAAYARTLATQRKRNVDAGRAGRHREPVLHRAGSARRDAAAHRPDRERRAGSRAEARRPDHHPLRRHVGRRCTPPARRRSSCAMTWQQRVLSAIAHPQIAYLLLTLGTLGLTIELWSPGAILPGVAGGICLLLAFFAFQVLPVSYAGRAADPVRPRAAGARGEGHELRRCWRSAASSSLLFGSMMLIDSPLPELQVGLRLIVPVTLGDRLHPAVPRPAGACNAQRTPPVTGASRDARRDSA